MSREKRRDRGGGKPDARPSAPTAPFGSSLGPSAAEIKLRAERRAGEMLMEMPKNPGSRNLGAGQSTTTTADIPTLDDLGITRDQSSCWQRIASLPEGDFERYIARTKDEDIELTTSGALKLAKDRERAEREGNGSESATDFDADAQWAEDEKKLQARYRAWPEEQRGTYVSKLVEFGTLLLHTNHPDIKFSTNGPLVIKEIGP